MDHGSECPGCPDASASIQSLAAWPPSKRRASIWTRVCRTVSGARSSWEASATNLHCEATLLRGGGYNHLVSRMTTATDAAIPGQLVPPASTQLRPPSYGLRSSSTAAPAIRLVRNKTAVAGSRDIVSSFSPRDARTESAVGSGVVAGLNLPGVIARA